MTTAKDVLDRARSQLGIHEDPFNSNKTPYTEWYGTIGAWCAMFVSWCFFHEDLPLPATTAKGFAYTPFGAAWFQRQKRWTTKPQVGAVVFFDFPGDSFDRISHVGIVEKVNADGTVTCIEGNTNAAGGRTGGMVMRHVRRSGVVGYGLPDYSAPVSGADTLPAGALLKKDDQGPQVAAWQRDVNEATSARLIADGRFGSATQAATIAFQKASGVDADGVVGEKTRSAMTAALATKRKPKAPIIAIPKAPARLLEADVKGADVMQWQVQMVKLGFPIDVDAIYGPKSEQACRELQQQRRLKVDGIVGRDTWVATFTPVG